MENEKNTKRLLRSRTDKLIFGVCGGLGKYFEIDSLIFRILFVLLVIGGGFGVLLYLILAILIPSESIPGDLSGQSKNDFGETIKRNANELAEEVRNVQGSRSARNVIGLLVVAFGLFLLAGNLFPSLVRWDIFWPIALIVVGLLIISRRKN